jgi:hypothetical protein
MVSIDLFINRAFLPHSTSVKAENKEVTMRRISPLSFVLASLTIALSFVDEAWADKAPTRPYQYVSLDEAVPEGFTFFEPRSITDSGRIYGTLFQCSPEACSPFVAVYRRGEIIVLHDEAFANTANNRGRVGGGVVLDPIQFTSQAALFARREIELIPPLTDEFTAAVQLLTNTSVAFVESFDTNFNVSYYLTKRGHVTPLNFGPDPAGQFDINDRGVISGTSFREDANRAFRYDPSSGSFTVLDPLPTEPDSWGQAINNRGHVLGYSFVAGGLERIGVWRGTEFHTYFVEGTPEVPTLSNRLAWNKRGLIVITDTNDLNSYLVPRPGVRLNLADLTEGSLPVWTLIVDINNRGDLIGFGGESRGELSSVFLLRRVGRVDGKGGRADSATASSPPSEVTATGARVRYGPALERILHERLYGGLGKGRTAKSADLPGE